MKGGGPGLYPPDLLGIAAIWKRWSRTGSSSSRPAVSRALFHRDAAMEKSYRLFNCGRCRTQVRICQKCDHGNQYCRSCAPLARQDSLLRAGVKYQRTKRGRENHAARQQRYLDNKMTHHGSSECQEASHPCPSTAKVPVTSALTKEEDAHVLPKTLHLPPDREANDDEPDVVLCDVCGQPCRPFARLDFLVTPRRAPPTSREPFP